MHRLWRSAHPHQAAARSVRRAQAMADIGRVRRRRRHLQPASRTRLHPAGDLLRLASPRPPWRAARRSGVHHSRPDPHPRAGGAVSRGAPPRPILAAGAGAGSAVAAVAVQAAAGLLPASWRRAGNSGGSARLRWGAYLVAGLVAAATIGPWLVVVLLACGAFEITSRRQRRAPPGRPRSRPCRCWQSAPSAPARSPR